MTELHPKTLNNSTNINLLFTVIVVWFQKNETKCKTTALYTKQTKIAKINNGAVIVSSYFCSILSSFNKLRIRTLLTKIKPKLELFKFFLENTSNFLHN